jgi:glycosyltransferase involved in cell wall biosynthesis
VKLGIVVQRYGAEISGGAELHARYVTERLARHAGVTVLTTCARDYITWRNELRPGLEQINGVPVHRFPVHHPRDVSTFGKWSTRVFEETHSFSDELKWLDSEGPTSRSLVKHIAQEGRSYDYLVFFSYRYYHAYHGVRAAPERAVLVPTAERDAAVGVSLFQPIFRGVRAIMYNSLEERAMIQAVSGNHDVPGVVVGVGSEVPRRVQPDRFRQRFGILSPFALYVGRIDENKGCQQLFDYFLRYADEAPGDMTLVLIGSSVLTIPRHPRIRHLGFLADADKFDAMAAAEVLVMPSFFESLSMVVLEAWALGRPVLVNGACDVLRGQSVRANAGLYYDSYPEFAETLHTLTTNQVAARALGENGRRYFRTHYTWPVIERKYMDMFERLQNDGSLATARLEPIPSWLSRRRRVLPPAAQVAAALPAGPVFEEGAGG